MTNVHRMRSCRGTCGSLEAILGGGSDIQLQTYYDRTNRKQANFAESRDTFDIDFIHHLTLPHGRLSLGLGRPPEFWECYCGRPHCHIHSESLHGQALQRFIQDEIPLVGNQLR